MHKNATKRLIKIRERNITTLDVLRSPAKLNTHYTIVTLSKLNHKPKTVTITKIKDHLASMYRHLVNKNEIDIIVDHKSLRYEKPKIRTSGYYKEWEDGIVKKGIYKEYSRCPWSCLLYTSPSPRDATLSRMPSSA